MKYDTIIFDLDGTLLNTLNDLKDSLNYALSSYKHPTLSLDEVRLRLGNGIKSLVASSLENGSDDLDYQVVLKLFSEYYQNNCTNKTTIYPEIEFLIEKLKSHNLKLAIISNKDDTLIQKIVPYYFKDSFDFYLGATTMLNKKPSNEMIDYAIKKLDTQREKVLYIGDSEVDYQTALNSNIDYLIATWGFRTKKELSDNKANNFIDTPKDVLNYIN